MNLPGFCKEDGPELENIVFQDFTNPEKILKNHNSHESTTILHKVCKHLLQSDWTTGFLGTSEEFRRIRPGVV